MKITVKISNTSQFYFVKNQLINLDIDIVYPPSFLFPAYIRISEYKAEIVAPATSYYLLPEQASAFCFAFVNINKNRSVYKVSLGDIIVIRRTIQYNIIRCVSSQERFGVWRAENYTLGIVEEIDLYRYRWRFATSLEIANLNKF